MSHQRITMIVCLSVMAGWIALTAAASPLASGAPSEPVGSRARVASTPATFDDMLRPVCDSTAEGSRSICGDDARSGPSAQAPGMAISELLSRMTPADRGIARIEIEPGRGVTPQDLQAMKDLASLWNDGAFDAAIQGVRDLESRVIPMALGISWTSPPNPAGVSGFADVRIGTRTEGKTPCVDFDAATGSLYSVIAWGSETGTAYWTVNRSTDHGGSWTETYAWYNTLGLLESEASVVGGYIYIGYLAGDTPDELRMRRCSAATGTSDVAYGYKVIADATPSTFTEIAVTSNADDYNNRIYAVGVMSDHTLHFYWDVATDGATFTDEPYTGSAVAAEGLSATWNHGQIDGPFLFVSCVCTDEYIRVFKKDASAWTATAIVLSTSIVSHTSISAHGDCVICAYNYNTSNGPSIRYNISYDDGDSWNNAVLAEPSGGPIVGFMKPTVDARSGLGTTIIYEAEMGEPDAVFYQSRRGYAAGGWSEQWAFNDNDVTTGRELALSTLSQGAAFFDVGAIYISGTIPYFDRPGEWTSATPDAEASARQLRLVSVAPCPSTDRVTINFDVPSVARVRLQILDVMGRSVGIPADRWMEAGAHAIPVNTRGWRSGTYFYRLESGGQERAGRFTLIR